MAPGLRVEVPNVVGFTTTAPAVTVKLVALKDAIPLSDAVASSPEIVAVPEE